MVRQQLEDENPDALFMDGYDAAILGIARQQTMPGRPLYSMRKILELLRDELESEEDAMEHFEYNIQGAWVGPETPLILDDMSFSV
jgi:hypothetical protein